MSWSASSRLNTLRLMVLKMLKKGESATLLVWHSSCRSRLELVM